MLWLQKMVLRNQIILSRTNLIVEKFSIFSPQKRIKVIFFIDFRWLHFFSKINTHSKWYQMILIPTSAGKYAKKNCNKTRFYYTLSHWIRHSNFKSLVDRPVTSFGVVEFNTNIVYCSVGVSVQLSWTNRIQPLIWFGKSVEHTLATVPSPLINLHSWHIWWIL